MPSFHTAAGQDGPGVWGMGVRLTFLGTAASEGFPNAFCGCPACQEARRLGGRNIRRRSSALLDDALLIDFGPDLMGASAALGIPLYQVRYLLQTHEHSDHLDPGHFGSRSARCGVPDVIGLTWFASHGAAVAASRTLRPTFDGSIFTDAEVAGSLQVRHEVIAPYGETAIGPYRVFSVPATHGDGIEAMLHAIERDGRRLFYATDTGPLPETVWQALAERGWSFDAVAMDHTFGTAGRSSGHLNAEQFVEHMEAMRRHGLLRPRARIIATHLAHHSNPLHEELVAYGAARGYEIAYDGLTVDI